MSTRGAAWVVLLLVEVVALSARYHWATIPEDRIPYGRWLVEPVFPAALTAALLAASILRRPHRAGDSIDRSPVRWPYVLAQPIVFFIYARSVAWIVSDDPSTSPYFDAQLISRVVGDPTKHLSLLWVAMSASLGVAALFCWLAAIFPPAWHGWWRWRGWLPLGGGVSFGLAAVATGWVTQGAWPDLGRATLYLVHFLLGLISQEVIFDPARALVGIDQFSVWIAPACSGYEGIGLVLTYLGLYLWLDRRNLIFPRALILLPIGAVAMWLANAVRITALVAVGAWYSPSTAMRGFHAAAGWLAFNVVALGMVAVARRARTLRRGLAPVDDAPHLSAPYLVPLLAMVATSMVTGAFSDGFDHLYPARILAAAIALMYFRRCYPSPSWTRSWEPVGWGLIIFGLWIILGVFESGTSVGGGSPELWGAMSPTEGWIWIVARVVGSVVVVPVVEEIAFRSYLLRRLISPVFESVPPDRITWKALLISSILFGVLHGQWLAGTAAGLAYGLAYCRRGHISDAIMAHGVTNGLLAGFALTTGDWSAWS